MPGNTVGFIGLGTMGKPMAKNLIDAGYEIVGYDQSSKSTEEIEQYGGSAAESAQNAASQGEITLICLPNSEIVDRVMRSSTGIMTGLKDGDIVIDMSTISPVTTEQVATDLSDIGVEMLDAPVSGGEQGAIEGTLSIMVGGDKATLNNHQELLEVLGDQITYCGDHGAGQITKACNQIVVSNTIQAISEALVFAEKGGADLEAVLTAISGGAASCWALDNRAPNMIRGEFDPGFLATHQYKDLRIATRAGETYGAPLPITQITHEMYKSMVETGHENDDNSGVIQIIEKLAGTKARID